MTTEHCSEILDIDLADIAQNITKHIPGSPSPTLLRNFFVDITTEEQAYWLGFISADGYVNLGYVTIAIAVDDIEHLQKFKKSIRYDNQIYIKPARQISGTAYTSRPIAALQIGSREMAASFKAYGLFGRKSETVQPWIAPNFDLQRAYWRGVFDGDGSINSTVYKTAGYTAWQMECSGNSFMVEGFLQFCLDNIPSSPWTSPSKKITTTQSTNVSVVNFSGTHNPRNVAKLLYDKATVYLDRKKEMADELIASYESYKWITKDLLLEKYQLLQDWQKVAEDLQITIRMVDVYRRRYDLPRRKNFNWNGITEQELLALKKVHGTWKTVAIHLGVSLSKLENYLMKARDKENPDRARRTCNTPSGKLKYDHITYNTMQEAVDRLGSVQEAANEFGMSYNVFAAIKYQKKKKENQ